MHAVWKKIFSSFGLFPHTSTTDSFCLLDSSNAGCVSAVLDPSAPRIVKRHNRAVNGPGNHFAGFSKLSKWTQRKQKRESHLALRATILAKETGFTPNPEGSFFLENTVWVDQWWALGLTFFQVPSKSWIFHCWSQGLTESWSYHLTGFNFNFRPRCTPEQPCRVLLALLSSLLLMSLLPYSAAVLQRPKKAVMIQLVVHPQLQFATANSLFCEISIHTKTRVIPCSITPTGTTWILGLPSFLIKILDPRQIRLCLAD